MKGPTWYEVSEVCLEEYKELHEWITSYKGITHERGITISWQRKTHWHLINFLGGRVQQNPVRVEPDNLRFQM